MEPAFFRKGLLFFRQTILHNFSKAGIGQLGRDLIPGSRAQTDPGILGGLPEVRIEAFSDPIRRVIPAPVKIQGELYQLIHAFHVWPVRECF